MARKQKLGKFEVKGLEKLQKQLSKVQRSEADAFIESCAKELAARLLAKVIKRTPVGDYPKSQGKKGGTLRRGWTAKTHEEAASGSGKSSTSAGAAYAQSLEIQRDGNAVRIEIINPVEYASYVEYGHRTASHKGWVDGKFMLTISEREIESIMPNVLEAKIEKFLRDVMG